MRVLQARMVLCRQRGLLSPDAELEAQSPLRTLKSMFPNTALAKHTPLDILLLAPEPKQPRTLIVRDLGAVHNDWVATEFVMAYFEGDGLSPPVRICRHKSPYSLTYICVTVNQLKKSVTATLEQFGY